jgi:hypothetical protein
MTPEQKREEFQRRIAQQAHLLAVTDRLRPCRHRGEATGETGGCRSCGGVRQVPLYACAVHGTCSLWEPTDRTEHYCGRCPEREA